MRGLGRATRVLCAALIALAAPASAQELTNHALGRPYTVSPAPAEAYADDRGPQPYAADAFYAGELTDGVRGAANYKAAEWVGWRDTSYTDPIRVTVDLGEPTWIDRIRVTVCGAGGSIEPPERIDAAVRAGEFPYDAFVQIEQIVSEEPYDPAQSKVYEFVMEDCRCTATQVRLAFEERTWKYLFVDEIEILGGPGGEPRILPVQDVLLEAESGQVDAGKTQQVEGAAGEAVLLGGPGDGLRFDLPLPAGDYTIRVRSLAANPDTFSELVPRLGGQTMRPQPVTNSVFTWQRSHFTQPADGPATISLTLSEGAGVYLDQVRMHLLTLDEPIARLREFEQDTILVADGESRSLVALDDAGDLRAQAEAVASGLNQRSGARPSVKLGGEVTEEDLRTHDVIALGDRYSNFAILRASPNAWNHIPTAPEDGGPQVYVAADPKGAGRNVIVLGGADAGQVDRSLAEFLKRLAGERTLTYPWALIPEPELTVERDRYRELAVESGQWIRQGAIRTLQNRWKAFTDDVFLMLGYRYLEYRDSPDTIRQVPGDGFIDAELFKIMCRFDRSEHNGSLTPLQRLQLTNTLLHMAEQCAGIFDWNCCQRPGGPKAHHLPEERTQILSERSPTIANNHQTFPAYSILTAGDYFSKYYDLPEAGLWLQWADLFMRGQLLTSKPQCDCWGYQDITMTHTARYAAATGRWEYFESEPLHQFLRLRFISHDNLGGGVGYGDVGSYRAPLGPEFREDNARNWLGAAAGRLDLSRINPQDLLGVYVHPLEPMWYDFYGTDAAVPLERCFDKITFREAIDPDRAYLLLDGLSRGYHGHWDGNSILRFTDNGRVWLCEGDYLKGDPKDHNTVTLMRNGESARPGLFSSLEARFESPTWAGTITRTPDYCGLDWDRHLIWHRPTDTFFLIDDMTAKQAGVYDMKCRFRGLGETSLADRVWTVEQAGGERFCLHAPGDGRLSEATEPEDAKNWQAYEFADPVPKLLHHRVTREMKPGDREALFAAFYAAGAADDPLLTARKLSPSAIITEGSLRAIVGTGSLSQAGLRIRARQFVLGPEHLFLVSATRVLAGRSLMRATQPVSLSLDLATGEGVAETTTAATLSIMTDGDAPLLLDGQAVEARQGPTAQIELTPGRHSLKGGFSGLAQALTAAHQRAWAAAEEAKEAPAPRPTRGVTPAFDLELPAEITCLAQGDLSGDGKPELLAGCADGTLAAVDAAGGQLWRHQFGARVNDCTTVDLDGDGRAEVACGVEDEHLHVLGPDGAPLWDHFFEAYRSEGGIEGHVRVVLAADFEGDGSPDLAVGSANTRFQVLDSEGNLKRSNGLPWELSGRHKASAIGAADLTGDGQLELLAGFTYFTRWIVDFADTSRRRKSHLGGCISGCGAIAAADVDGDGVSEAIFADKDGQVTACRKAPPGEQAVEIVWQKIIGEDAIGKALAGDLDGDGTPEILLASHSGFLALVNADGRVRWVRYADNQVTDAALIVVDGGQRALLRSSTDGSVAVYDAAGDELARWHLGMPVQSVAAARVGDSKLLIAAVGSKLHVGTLEGP